ncbi:MAG TPA: hypothetical protein VG456_14500 [Candidatus Sulfopaludibacter sp.]|jgi:hypothetical protein|nr:hypothetical protein [Candidatus Sulfopaludibacter sp.]
MLLGRFEEAWRVSDRLIAHGCPDPNRLWDGRPFAGKSVTIRCLHGFGDAIQFVRYARLIRREAAAVTVQTHPELLGLFSQVPFIDRAITWNQKSIEHDPALTQQIEVMELPRAFRTTLDSIPAGVPYLAASRAASTRQWPGSTRPRVGILWQSGAWDERRNASLADLRPLLQNRDVEFYSFQRGPGRDELLSAGYAAHVYDLSGDSPNVLHFAADLTQMDLLVTVDTMAAHLAGALARPVWVLLQRQADWRWMLDRSDSPWYPTMRLFRQHRQGEWAWPIRRICEELREFAVRFKLPPQSRTA